jgi:hypothetical protein
MHGLLLCAAPECLIGDHGRGHSRRRGGTYQSDVEDEVEDEALDGNPLLTSKGGAVRGGHGARYRQMLKEVDMYGWRSGSGSRRRCCDW